jgi:hypothetical protein
VSGAAVQISQECLHESRHLNQERLTLDGNFHCNKAKKSGKNNDPNDTSLYVGKAHFPEHATQKEYIRTVPKTLEASIPASSPPSAG